MRDTPRVIDEPALGDAFGDALLAQHGGSEPGVVIERDDGFVDVDRSDYFADVSTDPAWPWLRDRVGESVLDLGAGAGRGSLRLQAEGVDVVALDVSPGAIEVCRARGVVETALGTVADLGSVGPSFDTYLCLGNNLGLIGSESTAAEFFEPLRDVARPGCRLIGTMLDPYRTDNSLHLDYHARNRVSGRLAGEVRIRVRHERTATAWFNLLWASVGELGDIARAHHWELVDASDGTIFCAELRPR